MKKLFLVKLFLAVLFIALYTPIAMAANIKIKGAVKDKLSKEPLIGATIRLVGTQAGAVTDLDGNFELNGVGVLEGMYDIEVKYVGYKSPCREWEFGYFEFGTGNRCTGACRCSGSGQKEP